MTPRARQRRSLRGAPAAAALACGLALAPASARADGGFGADVQARGGALLLRSTGAHNKDAPTMLRSPTMRGSGAFQGVGLRILFWDDAFRIGLGETLSWAPDDAVSLRTDPLPAGYSTHTRSYLGGSIDFFVGAQKRIRSMTLYGELRAAVHLLYLNVALRSTERGFLGDTLFIGVRGDVGPRFGAMFRLGPHSYIDSSIHVSPLGPELVAGTVALGFYVR